MDDLSICPICDDPIRAWEIGLIVDDVEHHWFQFDRHTALGDARWAKAIYHATMT